MQARNNNNIVQTEETTLIRTTVINNIHHNVELVVAMDGIKRENKLIQVDMLHRGSLTTKVIRMSAQQMMARTTASNPMLGMLITMVRITTVKKSNQLLRWLHKLLRKLKRVSTNLRKKLKTKMSRSL